MSPVDPDFNANDSRMDLPWRPRRNRKSASVRGLVRETSLDAGRLIYPLFIHPGADGQPIAAMPGCQRWGLDSPAALLDHLGAAEALGVRSVVLFPAEPEAHKTATADEAFNDEGLVQRAVRTIKASLPNLTVITDVALDPYSSDGHDGLVASDGRVLNDATIDILQRQAVSQARAGADIISPSDMMDGRVAAIRAALDDEGFQDVSILAYTAKYASAYYGPFREALDSAPRGGDKKTYQMDPANVREALREVALDEAEGADMIMVKPAGPYQDVIRAVRETTTLPVAAYQVSGEYAMIKAAAANGWVDERGVALESLMGIRRAGADMILTYFAVDAARWLRDG